MSSQLNCSSSSLFFQHGEYDTAGLASAWKALASALDFILGFADSYRSRIISIQPYTSSLLSAPGTNNGTICSHYWNLGTIPTNGTSSTSRSLSLSFLPVSGLWRKPGPQSRFLVHLDTGKNLSHPRTLHKTGI